MQAELRKVVADGLAALGRAEDRTAPPVGSMGSVKVDALQRAHATVAVVMQSLFGDESDGVRARAANAISLVATPEDAVQILQRAAESEESETVLLRIVEGVQNTGSKEAVAALIAIMKLLTPLPVRDIVAGPEVREKLGFSIKDQAVPPADLIVSEVAPHSWADRHGMRINDKIVAVNGSSIAACARWTTHECRCLFSVANRPVSVRIEDGRPPRPLVRVAVAKALGDLGAQEALLRVLGEDRHAAIRAAAAEALGNVATPAVDKQSIGFRPQSAPQRMQRTDRISKPTAAEATADKTLQRLELTSHQPDADEIIGNATVEQLIRVVRTERRATVRAKAALALGKVAASEPDPAIAKLLQEVSLRDCNMAVRCRAAEGLVAMGGEGLAPLRRFLREDKTEENSKVRIAALRALAPLACDDALLLQLMRSDPSSDVQCAAAEALETRLAEKAEWRRRLSSISHVDAASLRPQSSPCARSKSATSHLHSSHSPSMAIRSRSERRRHQRFP
eukprot:TRINITY_DN15600_c0_g1_i1.p2 TRINITY_DN15600_c0_g1~~TRINITY_DN15600_c0_g1_i1.p2  ORF type:complete len:509 (+),score=105.02 TRINITY_DN15600_c0_g1_i1:42-1568(+)